MEQRRLRLGDTLDDYCPRERRVTNHVIVAMIEDTVKQTRCSTCDADHEYKQARVPTPRRKKDAGVLAAESADAPRTRRPQPHEPVDAAEAVDELTASDEAVDQEGTFETDTVLESDMPPESDAVFEPEAMLAADAEADVDVDVEVETGVADRDDDGPVHRRLIRATLPRPEGQVPERKETDFTVRQPGGGRGRGEIDGNRPPQGGQKRHRRPHRGGGDRAADTRFGGSPQGNSRGGGVGQANRNNGHPRQPQHGGGQPGGQRNGGGNGEGRFRRRRGR